MACELLLRPRPDSLGTQSPASVPSPRGTKVKARAPSARTSGSRCRGRAHRLAPPGSQAALGHVSEELLALLVAEALQAVWALQVALAPPGSSGAPARSRGQALGCRHRPLATRHHKLQSLGLCVLGCFAPRVDPAGAWLLGVLEKRQRMYMAVRRPPRPSRLTHPRGGRAPLTLLPTWPRAQREQRGGRRKSRGQGAPGATGLLPGYGRAPGCMAASTGADGLGTAPCCHAPRQPPPHTGPRRLSTPPRPCQVPGRLCRGGKWV